MNFEVSDECATRWYMSHSELDHLVQEVRAHLDAETPYAARRALDSLHGALERHFDVEEHSHFPLVERFSPEHAGAIAHATQMHGEILKRLTGLRDLVGYTDSATARHAFMSFIERFRAHEDAESGLIAALTRARDTSAQPGP